MRGISRAPSGPKKRTTKPAQNVEDLNSKALAVLNKLGHIRTALSKYLKRTSVKKSNKEKVRRKLKKLDKLQKALIKALEKAKEEKAKVPQRIIERTMGLIQRNVTKIGYRSPAQVAYRRYLRKLRTETAGSTVKASSLIALFSLLGSGASFTHYKNEDGKSLERYGKKKALKKIKDEGGSIYTIKRMGSRLILTRVTHITRKVPWRTEGKRVRNKYIRSKETEEMTVSFKIVNGKWVVFGEDGRQIKETANFLMSSIASLFNEGPRVLVKKKGEEIHRGPELKKSKKKVAEKPVRLEDAIIADTHVPLQIPKKRKVTRPRVVAKKPKAPKVKQKLKPKPKVSKEEQYEKLLLEALLQDSSKIEIGKELADLQLRINKMIIHLKRFSARVARQVITDHKDDPQWLKKSPAKKGETAANQILALIRKLNKYSDKLEKGERVSTENFQVAFSIFKPGGKHYKKYMAQILPSGKVPESTTPQRVMVAGKPPVPLKGKEPRLDQQVLASLLGGGSKGVVISSGSELVPKGKIPKTRAEILASLLGGQLPDKLSASEKRALVELAKLNPIGTAGVDLPMEAVGKGTKNLSATAIAQRVKKISELFLLKGRRFVGEATFYPLKLSVKFKVAKLKRGKLDKIIKRKTSNITVSKGGDGPERSVVYKMGRFIYADTKNTECRISTGDKVTISTL